MGRPLWQINAELAALKAERKAARTTTFKPGHFRSRTFRPEGKGQRDPRQVDPVYLSWLHQDTDCIACMIEGRPENPHGLPNRLEAAHQNLAIADKGWRGRGLGRRIHDARSLPLCTLHHTGLPNACDRGQRQFWDRLGIGDQVADLCAELYAAYQGRSSAMDVLRRFAADATASTHFSTYKNDPADGAGR